MKLIAFSFPKEYDFKMNEVVIIHAEVIFEFKKEKIYKNLSIELDLVNKTFIYRKKESLIEYETEIKKQLEKIILEKNNIEKISKKLSEYSNIKWKEEGYEYIKFEKGTHYIEYKIDKKNFRINVKDNKITKISSKENQNSYYDITDLYKDGLINHLMKDKKIRMKLLLNK